MKKIAAFVLLASSMLLVSCTKSELPQQQMDPEQWMQTHPRSQVSYTDYFTGNYIVQTSQGFAVIEGWGGYTPRDFDILYAHFQFTGMQTIYNQSGNYFTSGRVIANWLTWSEAWYLLNQLSNR